MTPTVGPDVNFLNVEYFFRIIYNLLHQAPDVTALENSLMVLFSQVWILVSVLAFGISAACIYILVQATQRLNELYALQGEEFATIGEDEAEEQIEHARWTYIKTLIESTAESDWRQAIMEADIMLDDLLREKGFPGDTIGDRLKSADRAHFQTLDDAWEAHKVRNEIAHQGSTFQLSSQLAYRTINKFENVFREFHFI